MRISEGTGVGKRAARAMKRLLCLMVVCWLCAGLSSSARADETARTDLIDRIIATAQSLYEKANGKLQRAYYKGDIYLCKNFTTYIFRQNRDDFRMAEYPGVTLVIPDNLPKDECTDFAYGVAWEDISAAKGNPFEVAAQFIYDSSISEEMNFEYACEFMMNVERGDFFQMSAKYESGAQGPHSLIFLENYDPEYQTVCWTDSHMYNVTINGIQYGRVQYGVEKNIDFFADVICHKTRGATLYRLRDDIVYAE